MFINKINKSTIFFSKFMLKYKKTLFYILILNIGTMLFNIIEPLWAKQILDISFYLKNLQDIYIPTITWLIIFTFKYILLFFSKKITLEYNLNLYRQMRQYIFSNILKKPMSFFYQNSSAYILSRCNNDIANLEGMMFSNIIIGLLAILQILIIIILMIRINLDLTLLVIILELIILYVQFAFPLKKLYKEHNEALANMDRKVQNIFDCIKLIKTANSNYKEETYYNDILNCYLRKRYKRDIVNVIRTIVTGCSMSFIYPVIIIIGGTFIYYNLITIGGIIAFIMYFQKINALFNEAFALIPLYKIAQVSADRLYEFIKIPNENINNSIVKEKIFIKEPIIFDKVSFCYDNKKILNDFSLKIYPNKINVIIGNSGVGKSTLMNLLLGFINLDSGAIYINSKNINEYKLDIIRNSIAFLSQESILFQRTLKENILYHMDKDLINSSQIKIFFKKLEVEEIFSNLLDNMNRTLTENGNNFSGGERQRLCLIRELLKNAEVYIFDEATSSLDIISEDIILRRIKKLSKSKTVIMITHKLDNTKIADIINVMDNGKICESGSYEELMNKKGMYYTLMTKSNDKKEVV